MLEFIMPLVIGGLVFYSMWTLFGPSRFMPGEHGSKYHLENSCTRCFIRYKLKAKLVNRGKKELAGNNWIKVLFDKGFRYFFTIGVMWYVMGQLQIVNDSLLIVAFTMPVIDIIAFDLIDKYRNGNKIGEKCPFSRDKKHHWQDKIYVPREECTECWTERDCRSEEEVSEEKHVAEYETLVKERQTTIQVGTDKVVACHCPMCNDGMACCNVGLPHFCNVRGAPWNK